MACYHPLHAFEVGINPDSGKPSYKIVSGKIESIVNPSKIEIYRNQAPVVLTDYITVPCGKCLGCRLDYSRQWAVRCLLEAKEYQNNQFITLTYSPENIKTVTGADRETGEIRNDIGTLVPDDLTKFIKDLRRYYKYHYNFDNIRFYACGEYGEHTYRPHFHIICFNLPIEDKKPFFLNANKDQIYTSEIIEKIWGKGLVSIGDVTWNSAAYVARYVMKKIKGKDAEKTYKALGVVPEFVRMSRKPGIAYNYYEQNKEKIFELDEIYITNKKGLAQKVKPSKYFDRLYDLESPEAMKAIKEKRRSCAEESVQIELQKTSLQELEYLELKERNKTAQLDKLKRVQI